MSEEPRIMWPRTGTNAFEFSFLVFQKGPAMSRLKCVAFESKNYRFTCPVRRHPLRSWCLFWMAATLFHAMPSTSTASSGRWNTRTNVAKGGRKIRKSLTTTVQQLLFFSHLFAKSPQEPLRFWNLEASKGFRLPFAPWNGDQWRDFWRSPDTPPFTSYPKKIQKEAFRLWHCSRGLARPFDQPKFCPYVSPTWNSFKHHIHTHTRMYMYMYM